MTIGIGFHYDHNFRGTHPKVSGDSRLINGHDGILLHRTPVIFHVRLGLRGWANPEFDRAKAVLLVKRSAISIDLKRVQPEMLGR